MLGTTIKSHLTYGCVVHIMHLKLIFQTVEAEITAMMPLQRTRGAESRVRNKLSNGPLRVQSNGINPKYSATCWHTSVAGDMLVSC